MSSVFTPRDPSATLNASRLYRPGALENYGPIAGTLGFGGAEIGLGENMIHDAERELEAARLAIAGKDAPTEAEMQRVRDARQQMAWAQFTGTLGAERSSEARERTFICAPMRLHGRMSAVPRLSVATLTYCYVRLRRYLPAPPAGGPTLLPHSSTYQPRGWRTICAGAAGLSAWRSAAPRALVRSLRRTALAAMTSAATKRPAK